MTHHNQTKKLTTWFLNMTPARATSEPGADPNNLNNQLATILRESFGIEPKGWGRVYQKSYPDYCDQLPYPRAYRIPEFAKFSREDGKTTLEHVGQFILQCREASANDTIKLKMFPLSLSTTAFTWFTSNSIYLGSIRTKVSWIFLFWWHWV
jgi:hypothetical protein